MASITFKNIVKTYDNGVTVIPDLNLEIKDKEFVILVGPSGCGKSTTLRMIAGLEEVTSGELLIGDRVVNNVAPKDRDIAMVFQSYALYPHMTVYENMAFALELKKVDTCLLNSKLEKAILKKIKSNKKHSNYHLKQKIMNEMINLGYSKQIVEEIINLNLEKENDDILEKEYLKLYNKFSKKYSGQDLSIKIKYNLLSKGFESDKINKLTELKKEDF